VEQLAVMEGATITFRISNEAGLEHNFYIGPPDALAANQTSGLVGVPTNTEGVQEFQYTVTPETASLQFACTVPGHYPLMNGTFVLE